ncbi:MAG: hypothetical protein DRG78_18525 [Epsilonproteobacteria bacterium]|nr:MAG: hypothetical protein DRG78_18525 [Campylobacterota bacterium]
MKDINTIVTENFNDNIAYLEKYHLITFKKLSALDNAIANGHYQERYELVYEDGNIDVVDKQTLLYLYSKKSSTHAVKSAESINYTLDNLFEGFERHKFTKNEINNLKDDKSFNSHLPSIASIIDYINQHSISGKSLKSIDKFIFFGVGLGLHIEEIHQKVKSQVYLIIEDDLELFRLSLFTINYQNISRSAKIFFSIFEDQKASDKTFNDFLSAKSQYNHYLKYFHLLSHNEKKLDEFSVVLTAQPHLRFLFHNLLNQYSQPLNYLFNDYKFLKQNTSFQNTELNKTPFLLLAMGPSLEKNIQWLKKNHKKFIILAVSSTLSYLEKEGITPNIIIHIDPFEWGDISFKKLQSIEFIKNSVCLFSTATPKNITSLINKENLYFFETGTSYKINSLKLSSPCVGSLSYQLLLVLNAKNIYMLGIDLAVDADTNTTHSSSHQFNKAIEDKAGITYKDSLIEVDGNFDNKVKTTPHFNASLQIIEFFATKFKSKNQNIYNLGSGAKITGASSKEPTNLNNKDISFLNFQTELKLFLDKNSSKELTKNEKSRLSKKVSHARLLQKKILKGIDYTNVISYLNLEISSESTELDKILDTYLRYMLSYVYDFFNTQEMSNKSTHQTNLNTILAQELLDIIEYYIKGHQWQI